MHTKISYILIKHKAKLQKILLEERQQWFLWVPVLYAVGILLYFAMPFEPNVYLGIAVSASFLLITLTSRKKLLIFYVFIGIFFISAGFVGTNLRALWVKSPVLEQEIRGALLQARIDEIDTYKKGYRVFLTNIKTDKLPADKIPKKIRLTVLTKIGDAKAGDIIEVRAALSPPPKAVLPDTYDFARDAFFQQIGATGFAVSDFQKIIPAKNSLNETIQQIRNIVAQRLINSVGGLQAEIAKALFIGDVGGIDNDTMVAIRNSGLAHLLSISGLHLVIVCAICFKMCRTLLALFPVISLNYNTKKIAAVCAIIGSYFYLLISGNPVPALRSFIMSAMVFLAMVFDRSGTPMRIVAIASLYILITAPENIISPSFQMSFGAVIGLIAAFQCLAPKLQRFAAIYKIPKIFMEVISTIISSLVATAATAPFAIYHFNRNSPYGILANILAIPMASFWIMPFGVLAIVLMPMNLEWLVAWPLKRGVDFVIWVSYYFADLPYANSTIPAINDWQLLLISLGFLWLALWTTKWRIFGLSLIFIAIIGAFFNKNPDIIINVDATLFAVKDEKDELVFLSSKGGKYIKNVWTARAGQEEINTIDESDSKMISCDEAGCLYKKNGFTAAFIKHPIALEEECGGADIFINMTNIKYNCDKALTSITLYNLKQKGAHAIFLGDEMVVKTTDSGRGRIWE